MRGREDGAAEVGAIVSLFYVSSLGLPPVIAVDGLMDGWMDGWMVVGAWFRLRVWKRKRELDGRAMEEI